MTDDELLEQLEQRLGRYEGELVQAQTKVERLLSLVANLKAVIAGLQAEHVRVTATKTLLGEPSNHLAASAKRPQRTAPIAVVPMPPRRLEYSALTLMEAARQVLSRHASDLHAADITRAIFESQSEAELRKAKRSLVTDLIRGAQKGLWRKVGPNRFQITQREIQAASTSPPSNSGSIP